MTQSAPPATRSGATAVGASAVGTLALGSALLGALAFGAVAVGALAIGRLAVGRLTVRGVRIRRLEVDELSVGRLTIRDLTRPVTLDVRLTGPCGFDDDDRHYTTYGIRATAEINREDFGMAWNLEVENGGFMVGKHVRITLLAEADLSEP